MASLMMRQSLLKTSLVGNTSNLRKARTTAPVARNVSLKVTARDGAWCPGSVAPDHLDGSLPGDYGFDPLGIAKDPAMLSKFREAELLHCRWCMLASVGMLAVEGLGYGSWIDAPNWVLEGEHATYFGLDFGPTQFLYTAVVQAVLMGFAEKYRSEETDPEKRMYPGGAFDPLGFSKGDMEALKLKEIKNGRLAMFSVFGYFMQGAVTHEGPIANWKAHIADPFGVNVATTNSVAVPYLHWDTFGSEFWTAAAPGWYGGN